jgi:alkylation response protein AidB-like acyl-CoA dehydrogenase
MVGHHHNKGNLRRQRMDFKLGEKEESLREEIRKFAREELPAGWVGPTVLDQECRDWEIEKAIAKKLAQKGWLVMSWPKEYGGRDASLWEQTVYEMEVGYWGIPGAFMGISGVQWVGPCLMLFGSEEQKKKYLPLIASGEPDGVWCTGYSEPNAGSDLANLQTRAVRDGDEYVINGQKVWTSAAHRSRWCWLMARTDTNAVKKHRGLSLFIVDMQSPGVTVSPLPNYYGRHHFNEVFFDNVRIPASDLVGEENRGWYLLMQALAFERRSLAPTTYGAFKRVLEELVQYVKETKHGGRALSQNTMIRGKLADMAIELEMLKLFAYQLTWRLSQGEIPVYESSRNKVMSDDLVKRIAIAAAEILGAYSQVDPDSKWARLDGIVQGAYLGFPGQAIAAGTDEVEKSIIGQFKLGLPKSY